MTAAREALRMSRLRGWEIRVAVSTPWERSRRQVRALSRPCQTMKPAHVLTSDWWGARRLEDDIHLRGTTAAAGLGNGANVAAAAD